MSEVKTQPPVRGATSRVLVVEDEADLVRVLQYNLRQAGYEVAVAGTVAEAMAALERARPDAVLLDLMLPDGSGLEVCRALRADPATRAVPVIVVSAKGEEIDRVVGFELGADDYVVKPYSVRELVLRVRAVLRRAESESGSLAGAKSEVWSFGDGILRVEPSAHRVWVQGREVTLTALELKLLTALIERRERVQSRDTLLNDVWGIHLTVETRTVDTHIKRLREKLGAAGTYIQTIRGVGYRFSESPGEG